MHTRERISESPAMSLRAFVALRDLLRYGCVVAALLSAPSSVAADKIVAENVLSDLLQPSGLAIQPGGTADRYMLLIAERGAGRIVRWSNLDREAALPVVTGFSPIAANQGAPQPLPIAFLDAGLFVVGADDKRGGLLRVFELPDDKTIHDAKQPRDFVAARDDASACLAIARSRSNEQVPDMLLTIARRENGTTMLQKARVQAGTLGPLQPLAKLGSDQQPVAITTSPSGRFVVVAHDEGSDDLQLVFLNPLSGLVELAMPLELGHVVALIYSPASGNLYAADPSAGIYLIEDASAPGQPACHATKIADVRDAMALAFAPDGTLYVSCSGDEAPGGALIALMGDL
jgi:hypothetical protein